ncbi:hypothetical protein, partial [Clostridium perfringens]
QAKLPELLETRQGDTVTLAWNAPGGGPFPMPVEVDVAGKLTTLPMSEGHGTLTIPAGTHYVVDPDAKILRRSVAVEDMQAWRVA